MDPSDWHNGNESGTSITLQLSQSIDIKKAVVDYAVNLEYDVSVNIDGRESQIKPRGFGLNCFPLSKKQVEKHLKEKRLISHEIDLSKSRIDGVRGRTTFFFPAVGEKALIPECDEVDLSGLGFEKDFFGTRYESEGILPNILSTNQGIWVPRDHRLRFPFSHMTVIDFFGESRPELSLDRRSFKGAFELTDKKLSDFASMEFRKAICEGRLKFYSPFWENLWKLASDKQRFFLRDHKARMELLKLPVFINGKLVWLSCNDIRKRFPEGVTAVFQRHAPFVDDPESLSRGFGNYSRMPQDLPVLAIRAFEENYALRRQLDFFWKFLFVWSELKLVEKKRNYYLTLKLLDRLNPVYEKSNIYVEEIEGFSKVQVLLAEYEGVDRKFMYSNNLAHALNVSHPIVGLLLSSLEKVESEEERALIASWVRTIFRGNMTPVSLRLLCKGLLKHGLIPKKAVRLFNSDVFRIRDTVSMNRLFQEPAPLFLRYS